MTQKIQSYSKQTLFSTFFTKMQEIWFFWSQVRKMVNRLWLFWELLILCFSACPGTIRLPIPDNNSLLQFGHFVEKNASLFQYILPANQQNSWKTQLNKLSNFLPLDYWQHSLSQKSDRPIKLKISLEVDTFVYDKTITTDQAFRLENMMRKITVNWRALNKR